MLSREDNERLVRVGKGTPLGDLFRLYWIPFLPSADLVKDGQPKRIRLLGEDLVAFRDSPPQNGFVNSFQDLSRVEGVTPQVVRTGGREAEVAVDGAQRGNARGRIGLLEWGVGRRRIKHILLLAADAPGISVPNRLHADRPTAESLRLLGEGHSRDAIARCDPG